MAKRHHAVIALAILLCFVISGCLPPAANLDNYRDEYTAVHYLKENDGSGANIVYEFRSKTVPSIVCFINQQGISCVNTKD